MSQALGVRPSELLSVGSYPDDPVAFWFDRAVSRFGNMVETDVQERAEKEKDSRSAQRVAKDRLMQWLDFDGTLTKQRFASPPLSPKRRVEE